MFVDSSDGNTSARISFFFVANRNRSSFSRVGAQICAGVAREVSDVLKEATASALRVKALLGIKELRPTTPVVGAARQHAGAASDSDGTTDVELRGDGRRGWARVTRCGAAADV